MSFNQHVSACHFLSRSPPHTNIGQISQNAAVSDLFTAGFKEEFTIDFHSESL